MTASTTTARAPFASLDARITLSLIALRQARTAARVSRTPETAREVSRAEEYLNALLDYRNAVRQRAEGPTGTR